MGKREKLPTNCDDFLVELDDCDDVRDAYLRLQSRISEYSAAGRPVPQALRECERDLITELAAQSQGR